MPFVALMQRMHMGMERSERGLATTGCSRACACAGHGGSVARSVTASERRNMQSWKSLISFINWQSHVKSSAVPPYRLFVQRSFVYLVL